MIPATVSVTSFDPATGEELTYNQWVPMSVNINRQPTLADVGATPTSASVTLVRCRTLQSGQTEDLPEFVAQKLGVADRMTHLHIQNIYAPATDTGPAFEPKPYPDGASNLVKAQIDVENEQNLERHTRERQAYPAALRTYILGTVMGPLITGIAMMGAAQGKL